MQFCPTHKKVVKLKRKKKEKENPLPWGQIS